MKATLEFNLDDLDDKMALNRVINSDKMASFIWDLAYNFFRKYEYVPDDESEASWYTVQRDIIEEMRERGIDVDELMR